MALIFEAAMTHNDKTAVEKIFSCAAKYGLNITGGKITRTSSRLCLGVEHGDYNGTELFGIGTDRFMWLAHKPNDSGKIRLFSINFPGDGVIEFRPGEIPPPKSIEIKDNWARFVFGADYILRKNGFCCGSGFDGVVFGDIPGGGMSRSASLTINLMLSILDVNSIRFDDKLKIAQMAQQAENEYVGSPCGLMDQVMIIFAKEGTGTHFNPKTNAVEHIPLGPGGEKLRICIMDTGTTRHGLEKSTYKIRRAECKELTALAQQAGFKIGSLADVRDDKMYNEILAKFAVRPELCARLNYVYHAQKRFYEMMAAWRSGDISTVGKIFRHDGTALRDDYAISGPELETMCDIARTVDGCMGERMLGGGDKGAAGALVIADVVDDLVNAVKTAYPRSRPQYADKFAVHICKSVDGAKMWKI